MVQVKVKIPAGFGGILAQKARVITFVNRGLQRLTLTDIFAADVDVAGIGPHRERRDQRAFDQRVGIMAHDLAVFAGARFGFVGVDHEIRRPPIRLLGHERPFQTGRKARPATTAQARCLDDLNDLVAAQLDEIARAVPMPALFGPGQRAVMHPVKVGKDAVLILEHDAPLPNPGACARSDMSRPSTR